MHITGYVKVNINEMAGIELPANFDGTAKDSNHSSFNGDESSIEALNWSDLEDDDLNEFDSKLLQSIHSQLSDSSEICDRDKILGSNNHQLLSEDEVTTLQTESVETVKGGINSNFGEEKNTENRNIGKEIKSDNSMIKSTLSIASDATFVDTASNAPVLDEGPIWAKGSKLYKFEENRRFNQKLTFCVLFSLVLAFGLGLGNLAAYNECEAEHKGSVSGNLDGKLIHNVYAANEKQSEKYSPVEGAIDLEEIEIIPNSKLTGTTSIKVETIPDTSETTKVNKPMIDAKYTSHAEELSRVLRMLDELSRKIDRFENTTRQLGGIVMLRDDYIRPNAPTKKSKFLGLLDDIMKSKGKTQKEVKIEKASEEQSWRARKEQVLDEIAEAVLGAMEVKENEPEITLETGEIYPINTDNIVDNNKEIDKDYVHSLPQHDSKTHEEIPKSDEDFSKRKKRASGNAENDSIIATKITQKPDNKKSRAPMLKSSNFDEDNGNGKVKQKKFRNDKVKKEKGNHNDQDKIKRNDKKYKDGSRLKEELQNWEMVRAKSRQESRMKAENSKNWSKKKSKNWQIERDDIRQKLRNKKFY